MPVTTHPDNKVVIPSDFEAARRLEEKFIHEIGKHKYSKPAVFAIKLALEEGLNNAIRHGNHLDKSKSVEVTFAIGDEKAEFTIADEGPGFNPRRVPDPTADENLEKPTGRGLMLIKAYMDEVHYNKSGNRLHMVKYKA